MSVSDKVKRLREKRLEIDHELDCLDLEEEGFMIVAAGTERHKIRKTDLLAFTNEFHEEDITILRKAENITKEDLGRTPKFILACSVCKTTGVRLWRQNGRGYLIRNVELFCYSHIPHDCHCLKGMHDQTINPELKTCIPNVFFHPAIYVGGEEMVTMKGLTVGIMKPWLQLPVSK